MAKVCVEFDANGDGAPVAPVRHYSTTIGDGTTLVHTINHDLGTRDVFLSLRDIVSGALDGYDVDVAVSSPDSVVLTFPTAPAAGSVRVNVLAAPAAPAP